MAFSHVYAREHELITKWKKRGMTIAQIAKLLERSPSTISRHVKKKALKAQPGGGRPKSISERELQRVLRIIGAMVKKAACRYDVTLKMVCKAAACDYSEKTLQRALHVRKIKFRRFRQKPTLEPADVKDRLQFGKTHQNKSQGTWPKKPAMIIDNKRYPVFLNGKARDFAARRRARGAYRGLGQGLTQGYVAPKEVLPSFNGAGGGKSVHIAAGVANGRIVMCKIGH